MRQELENKMSFPLIPNSDWNEDCGIDLNSYRLSTGLYSEFEITRFHIGTNGRKIVLRARTNIFKNYVVVFSFYLLPLVIRYTITSIYKLYLRL